ncbi:uncharacterized protein [Apostichopus japonicus]|uniref:uncharacterized protein isoform X1 n=1 Tax=Stichopus japonicus TaxID=307972 RepID=UPI003AB21D7D
MSRRRDTTRSTEPEYYSEILQHRDTRLIGQMKVRKVDLKFVPTGEELNAVYHTPLTEVLSKRQLPFFVRLKEELTLDERRDTKVVRRGRTLTLHFIIRPKKVFATDKDGKEIVLPLYARQLYDVLPREPHHDDKVFQGTAEVIQSKPLPKRLRILAAVSSGHPDESQEAGEIIDVSHIERRGQLKVLVGKSTITRKQFAFSEKMTTSSYTTMISKQPLHLSEIMKKYDLPLRVRKTEDKS